MATAAWRANELSPDLWQSLFYTKFTTVRTAVLTPIIVVFMFVVGAQHLHWSALPQYSHSCRQQHCCCCWLKNNP